jgi:hypothetical protein
MELIKNSENFNFNDTTENGWKVNGSINHETNGNINININVSNNMEHVGNFYYNKSIEGNIHMNHDVSEANRDVFVTYTDSVIDFVLKQF